ncbi:MAG: hypothetical protein IJR97_13870 [Clostridia bacterium]|nr:hypothetical protein [Clostridia bacterium]
MNGFLSDYQKDASTRRALTATRIVAVVLLAVIVIMGAFLFRSEKMPDNGRLEIRRRIVSDLNSAIDQVNRLDRIVTSRTAYDIGKVRQYIYSMQQLDDLGDAMFGQRLIADGTFSQLYTDLGTYETLTQAAKSSTMDAQQQLIDHLQNLKALLN